MSWITAGKLDAVLDIKFPAHPDDEVDIKALFEEIGRNVATITNGSHPEDVSPPTMPPSSSSQSIAADTAAASALSSATVTEHDKISPRGVIPGAHRLARPPLRAPRDDDGKIIDGVSGQNGKQVTVDIDLRFRDLKAAVPMFTSDLSVRNNALIRPIVAFIKYVPAFHSLTSFRQVEVSDMGIVLIGLWYQYIALLQRIYQTLTDHGL